MKKKNGVMLGLCIAVAIVAIAYAAFNATLNVNGTINATGTFSVVFSGNGSCTATTKVGDDTPTGTVTATANTTTATLSASLYTPGDVVTCTIPVKNNGNLRAKYVSSTVSNSLTGTSSPIAVTVSSSTGTNAIAASGTSNITVVIKYNWTGTTQPTTTNQTFTITANYNQAI